VDPDPDLDGLDPALGVTVVEAALDVDRALERPQRAVELHQEAVAGGLDLPAPVGGQEGPDHVRLVAEQVEGAGLIGLGRCGVPDRVGEHDRGETPVGGHVAESGPLRLTYPRRDDDARTVRGVAATALRGSGERGDRPESSSWEGTPGALELDPSGR